MLDISLYIGVYGSCDMSSQSRARVMVFNAISNNIPVISVLLVEETGVTGGNNRPATGQ